MAFKAANQEDEEEKLPATKFLNTMILLIIPGSIPFVFPTTVSCYQNEAVQ